MNKFFGLYLNEMTKLSRKIITIILLAVMIISVIGIGILFKVELEYYNSNDYNTMNSSDMSMLEERKKAYKIELDGIKSQIENIENGENEDEVSKFKLYNQLINIEGEITYLDYAIENNLNIYTNLWIDSVMRNYSYAAAEIKYFEKVNEGYEKEEYEATLKEVKASSEKDLKVLNKYKEDKAAALNLYLDYQDAEIKSNKDISKEMAEIQLESNELKRQYNQNGEISTYLNNSIEKLKLNKISLLNNQSDENDRPLTHDEREELINKIAVQEHYIKSGAYLTQSKNDDSGVSSQIISIFISFSGFFVSILMIILAGSTISSEVSTGSIKSLIISPLKRHKIYTAKILSLTTFALFSLIIMYITIIITNQALFSEYTITPYIGAVNGKAYELNFYLHTFLLVLIKGIDVFVFMMFAMMLSTVTRNTSASVGISIAGFFGGLIISSSQMLYFISKGEWRKFIPFANLYLEDKFFPYSSLTEEMSGYYDNVGQITSLNFSLIYIAVLLVCMVYTGYESFIKRDIK